MPPRREAAMTKQFRWLFVLPLACCPRPLVAADDASGPLTLESPDGRLRMTFRLRERGRPAFDVAYRDIPVAAGSLGLEFAGSGPLTEGLKVIGTRRRSRDETYA